MRQRVGFVTRRDDDAHVSEGPACARCGRYWSDAAEQRSACCEASGLQEQQEQQEHHPIGRNARPAAATLRQVGTTARDVKTS